MNDDLKNILEKVLCLYLKYGIKSITMDDVARELGISKKTLYTFVSDKTDLVKKILDKQLEEGKCYFDTISNQTLNAIEEIIEVHKHVNNAIKKYNPTTEYDLRKYYPELYKPFIEEKRNRMYGWILSNIKKGKSANLYRDDVKENIIAKLVVSRNEFLVESDLFSENEFNSSDFFNEILKYHIRGIATQLGVELYESYLKELK
jgi:AcrR family transcriptional regulator